MSTLDSINPNYDPDALKKFMGCTHLAMRDALYNQHQADQMSKGRNLTEEMQVANSLEDIPYEEFDVIQASQSRVVEEEVKKPNQSKAEEKEGEEEVEEEKDALQASPSRAGVEKEKRPDQTNKETEVEEEMEEEKNALQASPSRVGAEKEKRPDQTNNETNETKATEKVITVEEGEERRAGAKEKKTEEKKEEEAKDGKEGKKEAEEEGNANEEEESKKKKEKRKNTRSTNKGEGFELNTPQPAATKAIEKDEDFPAPEFHLSINATTPRKGRAPQHSILPRRERGRAPTKR